jgi:hypothetical protein
VPISVCLFRVGIMVYIAYCIDGTRTRIRWADGSIPQDSLLWFISGIYLFMRYIFWSDNLFWNHLEFVSDIQSSLKPIWNLIVRYKAQNLLFSLEPVVIYYISSCLFHLSPINVSLSIIHFLVIIIVFRLRNTIIVLISSEYNLFSIAFVQKI